MCPVPGRGVAQRGRRQGQGSDDVSALLDRRVRTVTELGLERRASEGVSDAPWLGGSRREDRALQHESVDQRCHLGLTEWVETQPGDVGGHIVGYGDDDPTLATSDLPATYLVHLDVQTGVVVELTALDGRGAGLTHVVRSRWMAVRRSPTLPS